MILIAGKTKVYEAGLHEDDIMQGSALQQRNPKRIKLETDIKCIGLYRSVEIIDIYGLTIFRIDAR